MRGSQGTLIQFGLRFELRVADMDFDEEDMMCVMNSGGGDSF